MFSEPLLQASQTVRTGTAQWLSEGVATFGLLLTILLGRQARPEAVPLLVALWIAAAYWATASTSFANPAVSLARAFSDSFAGIRPWDLPGFWLSQVAGALLAAAAAPLLLPPKD
jgi:glycerol uptake facilitator-like aquaporin